MPTMAPYSLARMQLLRVPSEYLLNCSVLVRIGCIQNSTEIDIKGWEAKLAALPGIWDGLKWLINQGACKAIVQIVLHS